MEYFEKAHYSTRIHRSVGIVHHSQNLWEDRPLVVASPASQLTSAAAVFIARFELAEYRWAICLARLMTSDL